MSENKVAQTKEKKKKEAEDASEQELASVDEDREDCFEELESLKQKYVRLSADFENYKKRTAKENREMLDFGNAQRLKELLFVLDNMERAIALSEESVGEKTDFIAFLEGIKLVYSQLLSGLEGFGVTPIDSKEGVSFDPNYHEAVSKENSETYESGAVISEIQKGYLLNGRLLRPAMVSVSQGSEKTSEKSSED